MREEMTGTLRTIALACAAALLVLFLAVVVLCLASLPFGATYDICVIAAGVSPCVAFSIVYRRGAARAGASWNRLLRLALTGCMFLLGGLGAFLAYASVSWTLYRSGGASVPDLWTYLSDPGAVKALFSVERSQPGGSWDLVFACLMGGAIGAFVAYGGWRGADRPHRSAPADAWPAQGGTARRIRPDRDAPVVDGKSKQRNLGLLLMFLVGGLGGYDAYLSAVSRAPFYEVMVFTAVLVVALGLLTNPIDPARLQAEHGAPHVQRFGQLPTAWKVLLAAAPAAGVIVWLAWWLVVGG